VDIERAGDDWVLVDGRGPSAARWRLSGDEVEIVSSSGRAYEVPANDVPVDVAVGLLALRDAKIFLSTTAGESAGAFALRAWVETSCHPLLAGRIESAERTPSWMDYRFTFLSATALGSGQHDFGLSKSRAGRG
jgi:hypothetical protein